MTTKISQLTETTSPKGADYVPVVEVNAGPSYISKRSTITNLATTILQGNAASATKLAVAKTINGVAFDGTANISIVAAVGASTPTFLGGVQIPAVATSGITNSSGTIGLALATTTQLGGVLVDGTTITANGSGVISAAQYSLPTATTSVLGGVKVDGTTVTISNGVITAPYTYTLPTATTSILGGVKVDGTSITISSGVISSTSTYTLPTASTTVLGGVKIDGSTITLNGSNQLVANYTNYTLPASTSTTLGGVIVQSANISGLVNTTGSIVLAQASATQLGGVKIGTGISIAGDGTISTTIYSLPIASTGSLGGVKVDGSSITIDGTGIITSNISAATTTTLGGVKIAAVGTSGINNTSGAISLATATDTQLGGVKVDNSTIVINSGVISVAVIAASKIAIGQQAGNSGQGTNAVAIGAYAGQTNQAANTIILNASGSAVNGVSAQASSFYVNPIRSTTPQAGFVYYNSGTYEVVYSTSLGYPTGSSAGAAVTQTGGRTNSVTINKLTGQITLFAAAGSATPSTFTVNNSTVAATDTVIVNCSSSTNTYLTFVTGIIASTSFNITFYTTGGVSSDSPVFNFTIIKGSAN
jgi:hypothetical protein